LKHPKDAGKAVKNLVDENSGLRKKIEVFEQAQWAILKDQLKEKVTKVGTTGLVIEKVTGLSGEGLKKVAFDLKNEVESLVALIGSENDGKALLGLIISDNLLSDELNAGKLIKKFAAHIRGGGGGQPFFATAGGVHPAGIPDALDEALEYFQNVLNK